MGMLEEYIKNPCGTLSIPYWKNENIEIPKNMKIIHDNNFSNVYYPNYHDEPYFRLFHSLKDIETESLNNFILKTATLADIPFIVNIINQSYLDIAVTDEQLVGYTQTEVYNSNLWIIVFDRTTGIAVGCGIAELDKELHEGILEWVQVLPEYRGKKIGQFIVKELLKRLADMADFATVSGKINDLTRPELLYRKCGFIGNDIWHILTKD